MAVSLTTTFPTQAEVRLLLEFALEGVRFFDLVRLGIARPVLNKYLSVDGTIMPSLLNKAFLVGQHEIRPIPEAQIDLSKKTVNLFLYRIRVTDGV